MKNKGTTIILALFLGGIGIHRFYLGKKDGILYLLFFWTFIPAVIAFIEFFVLLFMSDKSFNAAYNKEAIKSNKNNKSDMEALEKLHAMLENNVITKEEFEKKKKSLLS